MALLNGGANWKAQRESDPAVVQVLCDWLAGRPTGWLLVDWLLADWLLHRAATTQCCVHSCAAYTHTAGAGTRADTACRLTTHTCCSLCFCPAAPPLRARAGPQYFFKNNFRNPLGVSGIAGLFLSPAFLYAQHFFPQVADSQMLQCVGVWLHCGRAASACLELFFLGGYLQTLAEFESKSAPPNEEKKE